MILDLLAHAISQWAVEAELARQCIEVIISDRRALEHGLDVRAGRRSHRRSAAKSPAGRQARGFRALSAHRRAAAVRISPSSNGCSAGRPAPADGAPVNRPLRELE